MFGTGSFPTSIRDRIGQKDLPTISHQGLSLGGYLTFLFQVEDRFKMELGLFYSNGVPEDSQDINGRGQPSDSLHLTSNHLSSSVNDRIERNVDTCSLWTEDNIIHYRSPKHVVLAATWWQIANPMEGGVSSITCP